MNLVSNFSLVMLLSIILSCNKKALDDGTKALIPLETREANMNNGKHSKVLKPVYGILSVDQRFESTDIVPLASDTLLAVLSNNFDSESKHVVFKTYSYDGGITWSTPENINLPYTNYRFTACNLFKMKSRIYLLLNRVAGQGQTMEGGIPALSYSDDDGLTWTKPRLILKGHEREIVVINSRNVTVTRKGRIIIPVRYGQFGVNPYRINIIFSDNGGRSWTEGPNSFKGVNTIDAKFAEPSIAELKDGRLIMLIRTTLGHIYKSYSSDNGDTWTMPECTSLVSPWTAHSIRVTKQGYILVAYTNAVSRNDPGYPRNNLKFAISYDNGNTWRPSGTILEIPESSTEFLMEPNITLLRDKCLVTYFHQTARRYHRIETAIFDKKALLREEEYWENLDFWNVSGKGMKPTGTNRLRLSTRDNFMTALSSHKIIPSTYAIEFKTKINSFVRPEYADKYTTLGLLVSDGHYKLMVKLEEDGIYFMNEAEEWKRNLNEIFLKEKHNWHSWKIQVDNGTATIFLRGKKIEEFKMPTKQTGSESLKIWSHSNLDTQVDGYIDYIFFDPL